jgi:UDP-2,3-diacylglucosamine hydrolase
VLSAPTYVLSDLHLGIAPPEVEPRFLRFLDHVRETRGALVINGDLFDFWFEWRTVIPRGSFRVLAALARLRDAGCPVSWVAGNHDCWGGAVLREDVGVDFVVGALRMELAGWRACVEHGDGLRVVEDRKYRRLRTVLRHPLSVRLFRLLHPDWGTRLATGSSHASRHHGAHDEGSGLRLIALERLAADPTLDLVVFGHSHDAVLERAPGGGVYANAGSWLDAPTYLRLTPDAIELRRWDDSAEGERLDLLDRRPQEALTQP